MYHVRKNSIPVTVGSVSIGGASPIVVQSMTNTDTADIASTVKQIYELWSAGSEIVRVTVNNEESAAAVATIRDKLAAKNCFVPIVGDFHYNGHTLLNKYPECAEALAKYRINPGNVGFGEKHDPQFRSIVEKAIEYNKPVRIGVNWGSLDQTILSQLMDENARLDTPQSADDITREALVQSALISCTKAEQYGLASNKIVISAKVSRVQDLVWVYRQLAARSSYALHLGLTEAGTGSKGIVASTAALAIILQEGIGDTIRVSLTPAPDEAREKEVIVAQEILQSLGIRAFSPMVTACPGCGRTTSTYFQSLAAEIQTYLRTSMPRWKEKHPGVESMNVAVMGCIVNGPGESKHSNIGISLPGTGESPVAPVFVDGKKAATLRGENIATEFKQMVEDYVIRTYTNYG